MNNENKNEPTPEGEIFNQIMFEIKRYENNQLKFKEAVEEFFEDMLNDDNTD